MMNAVKNTISNMNNISVTENGALGYKTTGSALTDLNFRVSSMRTYISDDDIQLFIDAMNENLEYAIKWLFFVRDIRGGLGERDTFQTLFGVLSQYHKDEALKVVSIIAEYGRWKDVVDLSMGLTISDEVRLCCLNLISTQLRQDVVNYTEGKSISLLAKWMPSINASQKSRSVARELCKYLCLSFAEYRKMLSKLRKHLDVTEVKTCANKWGEIDYNKVSSNANLRYKDAFLKHDEARRREYLKEILTPSVTSSAVMHAENLYPYEIWYKYLDTDCWTRRYNSVTVTKDDSLEAMWRNLKEIGDCGNTMVVCDGSGSMCMQLNGSSVYAIDVARSLAVYFAERCDGQFKNQFIEFSSNPKFIDLRNCETLCDKIKIVNNYNDCSSTDIEKTFMIILKAAIENNMTQADMPERLLIVSDMEFNEATTIRYNEDYMCRFKTLFDSIADQYAMHGFKMPKLVFWNVFSRTKTIPVTSNEAGVILVSGFSVNIATMVMSGQVDPWLVLKEQLDSPRYQLVSDKLNS